MNTEAWPCSSVLMELSKVILGLPNPLQYSVEYLTQYLCLLVAKISCSVWSIQLKKTHLWKIFKK